MRHPSLPARAGSFSRRAFLHIGAAGLAGLSLDIALRRSAEAAPESPAPRAKNVIFIFLTGGPATIDMWDMKPAAPLKIRGEFQPVDTSIQGVQICEHLPKLAAQLNRTTLVRSLAHTIAEHTQGVAYLMTGNRPSAAREHPSLGSAAANLLASSAGAPPYITLGPVGAAGAATLGRAFDPLALSAPDEERGDKPGTRVGLPAGFTVTDLDRRQRVLAQMETRLRTLDQSDLPRQLDRFQQQALDILRSDKINKALAFESESSENRERYGQTFLGKSALAARRLIEAGARFVTIGFGDWDTHNNNFARLRNNLLPQLDRGLSSLIVDLDERGLLAETIVYCTGEFGRTPAVNGGAGRDHWARSMAALLAGGGFRRGFVCGATDAEGYEPTDSPCSPDDISASIFRQFGFAPGHSVLDNTGRPLPLFRDGRALSALVG